MTTVTVAPGWVADLVPLGTKDAMFATLDGMLAAFSIAATWDFVDAQLTQGRALDRTRFNSLLRQRDGWLREWQDLHLARYVAWLRDELAGQEAGLAALKK